MKSPGAPSPPPLLPDEVVAEILSWLSVNSLVRFRCVSKSCRSLISDPTFVKLHLQRSPKYANILLTAEFPGRASVVGPCSLRSLTENPSSAVTEDDCYRLKQNHRVRGSVRGVVCYFVCGSVNGLVCLRGIFTNGRQIKYWFRFWNPATRSRSRKSPCLPVNSYSNGFGFGYDNSSDAYKVVAILDHGRSKGTELRVHTKGQSCWRKILSFPACPTLIETNGQFVSGTLNWLAVHVSGSSYDWDSVTVKELVIFSFDLGKETYQHLLMPHGLDEDSQERPRLTAFRDCLCLCHDYKGTYFVVWQMEEFGVEKSWTQLVKVSYQHLQIEILEIHHLKPLCISENGNGDAVLILKYYDRQVIEYNCLDHRVEHTEIPDNQHWVRVYDYVPSLVLPS